MTLKKLPEHEYSYDNYAKEITFRIQSSNQVATETLMNSKITSKNYHDKSTKRTAFNVGDYVLLKNETISKGRSKKLVKPWLGPFKIISKDSALNYTLLCGKRHVKVRVDRIKPFTE